MPTWLRVILHGVAYVLVLFIGVGIGAAGHADVHVTDAPSTATPNTIATATTPPTVAAADVKQAALGRLYAEAQKRGSLVTLTEGQLKTAMDTFVCKHLDDLMALTAGGAGISGSDAGYLWGVNAVEGYC